MLQSIESGEGSGDNVLRLSCVDVEVVAGGGIVREWFDEKRRVLYIGDLGSRENCDRLLAAVRWLTVRSVKASAYASAKLDIFVPFLVGWLALGPPPLIL